MDYAKDALWHRHSSIYMRVWWQRGGWTELVISKELGHTCCTNTIKSSSGETPSNSTLYECEFADDVALLATTRAAAERAIKTYTSVASRFGMTVNIQKTKFMVVGSGIEDEDLQPIIIEGGEIENVKEFSYLGSLIAENGRIDTKVDKRIANASKAFGALR